MAALSLPVFSLSWEAIWYWSKEEKSLTTWKLSAPAFVGAFPADYYSSVLVPLPPTPTSFSFTVFQKIFYIFFLRVRGREGEKAGENIDVWEKHWQVASSTPPTGDLARNPGMCIGWESTGDLSVCRPVLNPLDYTSQDQFYFVINNRGFVHGQSRYVLGLNRFV